MGSSNSKPLNIHDCNILFNANKDNTLKTTQFLANTLDHYDGDTPIYRNIMMKVGNYYKCFLYDNNKFIIEAEGPLIKIKYDNFYSETIFDFDQVINYNPDGKPFINQKPSGKKYINRYEYNYTIRIDEIINYRIEEYTPLTNLGGKTKRINHKKTLKK